MSLGEGEGQGQGNGDGNGESKQWLLAGTGMGVSMPQHLRASGGHSKGHGRVVG